MSNKDYVPKYSDGIYDYEKQKPVMSEGLIRRNPVPDSFDFDDVARETWRIENATRIRAREFEYYEQGQVQDKQQERAKPVVTKQTTTKDGAQTSTIKESLRDPRTGAVWTKETTDYYYAAPQRAPEKSTGKEVAEKTSYPGRDRSPPPPASYKPQPRSIMRESPEELRGMARDVKPRYREYRDAEPARNQNRKPAPRRRESFSDSSSEYSISSESDVPSPVVEEPKKVSKARKLSQAAWVTSGLLPSLAAHFPGGNGGQVPGTRENTMPATASGILSNLAPVFLEQIAERQERKRAKEEAKLKEEEAKAKAAAEKVKAAEEKAKRKQMEKERKSRQGQDVSPPRRNHRPSIRKESDPSSSDPTVMRSKRSSYRTSESRRYDDEYDY